MACNCTRASQKPQARSQKVWNTRPACWSLPFVLASGFWLLASPLSLAADWPTWGVDGSRNMVSTAEKGLPVTAKPGEYKENSEEIDPATTENVKWVAKLGTQTYGNPTAAGGRVYVGTNNSTPRDPEVQGDYGILMCLEEQTGKLLWQLASPKLSGGRNVDYEDCGICSPATVDDNRVYVVTNRCEVVCLDAAGMSNGNDGPFKDEGQYIAGPGKPAIEVDGNDADILWVYDMRFELGVFPHFMASSAVLVVGDRLYVTTSNGVDWTDVHVPAPDAPALICLDKNTGKLLGQERSGISGRTLYCNWSSPAHGNVGGKPTVVVGGGDGVLYGFDPQPGPGPGAPMLKELWRIDCNPPEYRTRDGKPLRYRDPKGPSEVIATPVVHGDRVYVAIGQDPEHPDQGVGCLNSVGVTYDPSGKAKAEALWRNTKIGRSVSTIGIIGGLLFTADSAGMIYCIDAATGAEHWRHDAEGPIWVSPVVADGKMYIGNENGELFAFAASKEKQELGKIDCGSSIYSSAVPANGVLYVATAQQLFAFKEGARGQAAQ